MHFVRTQTQLLNQQLTEPSTAGSQQLTEGGCAELVFSSPPSQYTCCVVFHHIWIRNGSDDTAGICLKSVYNLHNIGDEGVVTLQ